MNNCAKKVKLSSIAHVEPGQSPESIFYSFDKGTPFLQGNRTFGNLYPEIDTYTTQVTKIADKDDVLMSVRAPVGDLNIAKEQVCIGRGLAALKALNGDNKFLFYALKYNIPNLLRQGNGTTYDSVNKDVINDFDLVVPKDDFSNTNIGKLLFSLDQKIEINTAIIRNLENICVTLFSYWFLQYEFPNSNNKPYKTSNGEFIYNIILKREIPKSWKVGTILDLGQIEGGTTPSKSNKSNYTDKGIPWITPKDLSLNQGKKFISRGEIDVSESGYENANLIKLPKGTVLLSSRAPIGYIAIAENDVTTNQGFKSIIPNKGYPSNYVYFSINKALPTILNFANGSTYKEISGSILEEVPVILADKATIDRFEITINPIVNKQLQLERENRYLAKLKSYLLPLLMNGQVSVKM